MDSIISKVLALTTFLLVVWLGATVNNSHQRISRLETQLSSSLQQNIGVLNQRINSIVEDGEARHEEMLEGLVALTEIAESAASSGGASAGDLAALQGELDTLRGQAGKLQKSAELGGAHKTILVADLEKATDAAAAAEKLLATKEAIWKFSLEMPDHEGALQGLMGPIDGLAAQWQSGDTSAGVAELHTVLSAALASLEE